ncbi:Flavodoxin reductases (ferredoxin-NADPH reductases) family 1 [Actinokineospora spheciospongiae]|uniref:Flavodoxin reductases (Ferredoxin-NADPH reductases) family 1 n=1 Tax=Actinokineospora spheciospongiae TaxID=909613 RepID=W7IPP3_9PSEU|nr:Flavodoxin reductases (ferredoxin-NADPH reductases) family 1 [Actinokineospora spheciospongiae]
MLTSPLLPDDYFALLRPRWSARETTGTVVRLRRRRGDAVTVVIQPDFAWPGHVPGQYLRIGLEIDGIRHWRAYTITSDPDHPGGVVSITVKRTEGGRMSPVFAGQVQPGRRVFLGEVEGEFTLPEPLPGKVLFLSAGSGVTPIMSMVRELQRRDALDDVVHVHSARTENDMIFGTMLRRTAERAPGYRLVEVHTAEVPRFSPDDLDRHCPDWRERQAFLSGPRAMIDAVVARFDAEGLAERLHVERFQPVIGIGGGDGAGGRVRFRVSDAEAACGTGVSILVGGERAGVKLPFGCRMGICRTCVGRLRDGAVRDLRTGAVETADGQMVRTCISAPEGDVEIDL